MPNASPANTKKKVAVITMARNDDFFLTRWINYYGKELGEENLYIYLDGEDQPVPKNAGKVNVFHEKRVVEHVVSADKRRIGFLSKVAKSLLQEYDLIIGVDADEFLVVDPKYGKRLVEYLSEIEIKSSVSGLGMDVGQHMGKEKTLKSEVPFLSQREYALISTRYTKTSVISKEVNWGSGFHRIRGENFHIDSNLYLFHFGSVDYKMMKDRFLDQDRMATGWERHTKKRLRTINIITKSKAKVEEKWLSLARTMQTYLRPIYALNKPSMAGWKLVIKIPDRFKGIV